VLVFSAACTQEEGYETLKRKAGPALDHALLDNEVASIYELIAQVAPGLNGYGKTQNAYLPGCVTVRFDTLFYPDTLTFDFGTVGCVMADGVRRRGQIRYVSRNGFRSVDHFGTVFLDNYELNGSAMTASIFTIQSEAFGAWNGRRHRIQVLDARYTTETSQVIRWSCNRVAEQFNGLGTAPDWFAEYRFRGTAEGLSASGQPFTVETEADLPLIRKATCRNFVSGLDKVLVNSSELIQAQYDDLGIYADDPRNPEACDSHVLCRIGRSQVRVPFR
jgi:hypothetical protein